MTHNGELPLVRINEDTKQHVTKIDECLSTDHTLPKVERSPHLRHELDEQRGTTIRVNSLHQSNDLTLEAHSIGWTCSRYHGTWVYHVGGVGSRVIRECVCCDSHGRNNDDDVQPDGEIRQMP